MLRTCCWAVALACVVLMGQQCPAGVLEEDFSEEPAANGWRAYGNTNFFSWNAALGALNVTWDSSSSNSYFYHPLGTVLGRDDDFSLEFDLRLVDITTPTKPGPFEIAVGFINLADSIRGGYSRGIVDPVHGPRNIVEFDYFPVGYFPGYGDIAATVSPTMISSNGVFAAQFPLMELTNDLVFHITLNYGASNATLRTTLSLGGAPFGEASDVVLGTNFTDFRVDTVAISSYSDAGDPYDSVLAHGVIDNLLARIPPPPVGALTGGPGSGGWQVQFTSRANWSYTLEQTTDLATWTPVSERTTGNGATLTLRDSNPPSSRAFYRVRAERN